MRFHGCFKLAALTVFSISLTAADALSAPPMPTPAPPSTVRPSENSRPRIGRPAPRVSPRPLPTPLPVPPAIGGADGPDSGGKGTIGLICMDTEGRPHVWSAGRERPAEFDNCVGNVIQGWEERLRGGANNTHEVVDVNLFLGGYRTYLRQAEDSLMRALFDATGAPAPTDGGVEENGCPR
jgi:hypothetical protein